jgi:RNA 3'-terminal phosphate cyclase (ATP)
MARRQKKPIHLEGTTLEGGGQLLRLALSLASLTRKHIHITNIRGKRSGGGGLKAQHLTSLQWLGQACNAGISGAGLKSKEITFRPDLTSKQSAKSYIHECVESGHINITQSTPGSVLLVLQAVLPYLLFSGTTPIRLRITGGTNVSTSPSYDYIEQVLLPVLELIGIPHITAECHSRGWSHGSIRIGSATYTITPLTRPLLAFNLIHRGAIKSVRATIIAPQAFERDFRDELDLMFDKRTSRIFGTGSNPDIEITFEDSHHDKRFYLLLVATSTTGMKLGRDWLFDQAVRVGRTDRIAPNMVKKVSDDLLAEIEHGGCVDEFLRDQLVVFQALARGTSRVDGGMRGDGKVEPSLHARTAQWVADRIVGVEFDEEGGCEGIGFVPGGTSEGEEEELAAHLEELDVSGL